MAAVISNLGLDKITQIILQKISHPSFKVALFTNNIAPTINSTWADFTECTIPGYVQQVLGGGTWTGATANGVSSYSYVLPNWVFNAYGNPQQTIFGYAVLSVVDNTEIWAEAFVTPYTVPLSGGSLALTLNWNDNNC